MRIGLRRAGAAAALLALFTAGSAQASVSITSPPRGPEGSDIPLSISFECTNPAGCSYYFQSVDGTAADGEDYVGQPERYWLGAFDQGFATTVDGAVSTFDDELAEGDEDFQLVFEERDRASDEELGRATATFVIVDDEARCPIDGPVTAPLVPLNKRLGPVRPVTDQVLCIAAGAGL